MVWAFLLVAIVALIFGGLYLLSSRIEPEDRETGNDEWMRKGD